MNRRKFLSGIAIVTGSSSVVSTGAFSSVSASRSVSVSVSDDDESLLRLEELGDGRRSVGGDSVEFAFPSFREQAVDTVGLGPDSVYEFSRDANEGGVSGENGLLRITNQGTNRVEIYSTHSTDSEIEIELYDVADRSGVALRDDPPILNPGGDPLDAGFRIKTFDSEPQLFDEKLTIVAEVPER